MKIFAVYKKEAKNAKVFGGKILLFDIVGPVFEVVERTVDEWDVAILKIGIAVNPLFEFVIMFSTTWRK